MKSPPWVPQVFYDRLAYQYPWNEDQPAIRIPVAGPEPYNTLAVVRARTSAVTETVSPPPPMPIGDGSIDVVVPTDLVLTDFAARTPELQKVRHSSSANIRMLQTCGEHLILSDDNIKFLFAVYRLDYDIDRITGQFRIRVHGSTDIFDTSVKATAWEVEVSSWVLYWERRPV